MKKLLLLPAVLCLLASSVENVWGGIMAEVLASNPVSYWRMEETSGNTINDLMGVNDGTRIGGTLLNQSGAAGNGSSVYFDGNGDYITIADSNSLDFTTAFTLEMWIKPEDLTSAQYILDKHVDQYSVILGYQANNVNFYPYQGATQMLVQANVWSHIVFTKDNNGIANNWRGYVNGVQKFSFSQNFTLSTNTGPLNLGSSRNIYSYKGYLDEVAVYNHALTASQVQSHFIAGSTLTTVPEPTSIAILGIGMCSVLFCRKRFSVGPYSR